jgi:uncharacterized damage-inducible protein DinB
MTAYRHIEKPGKDEYPSYSVIYMDLVADDGLVLQHLHDNLFKIKKIIESLSGEQLNYRYAAGKWTIKEILVHIIDDERIFSYRALRYSRNDNTPLPGFEQDNYTRYAHANDRSLESIFDEYDAVRKSTIQLFQHLPADALLRTGSILENGILGNTRTVRAMVYHIAGHELRHIKIIKERYLNISTANGII